ncbi:uncharacterized protein LOC134236139 [Saccostrea cucullata]|uniref:uncharacterized protein LOC134236139 n=1 Tax=Saccostrea cuccullata TaxID=36930 RepID=UPI002ED327B8
MDGSLIPNTAQHYVECGTYACRRYSKFYCKTCHQRRCEQCTIEHLKDPRKRNHEVVLYQDRLNFLPEDNNQFNVKTHQANRSLAALENSDIPDTAQHYVECDSYGCSGHLKFYCRTCYQGMCEQCKYEHLKEPLGINHDIVLYQHRRNQRSLASDAIYIELCRKIGTQTEVTVRRGVQYLSEMIQKPLEESKANGWRSIRTGGRKDGFEIDFSDKVSSMRWQCNHYVICDFSQAQSYNLPRDTLIYMHTSHTPPGFAKLELLTESRSRFVISSLVNANNAVYISTSLFKKAFFDCLKNSKHHFKNLSIHEAGLIFYFTFTIDLYRVESFYSRHWPSVASLWFDRSLTKVWPSRIVCQSILKEGFHLVPIGSNLSVGSNDLEWRISFSKAEEKLTYSLNHVQFICYGLLKIFLKEIICDKLLCSYFMKTILFWKIQNNPSDSWTPSSLLKNFWNCYKCLMHSIYSENLPNFFIPENNMLAMQIRGPNKLTLFQKLEHFYKMGVSCLLYSPYLREILNSAFSNPLLMVRIEECYIKSETDLDIALFMEIDSVSNLENKVDEFRENMMKWNTIDMLYENCGNFILQKFLSDALISTAMSLKLENSYGTNRKRSYKVDRTIIHLFDFASKIGYISDILYLALYLYDKGRYNKALNVAEIAKRRLTQGHVMYNGKVDRKIYSYVVCGKSLSTKLRKHWARDISINVELPYIDELKLEQQICLMNEINTIKLPPLVTSHMLCVLCHYRLRNRSKYLESLTDLHTLLVCDKGVYVPVQLRDISWQILGICQNLVGDFERALNSYMESIEQNQHHKIKKASEIRIDEVCSQLNSQ